jgi:Protein of unknown function (DUF2723)
MKDRFQAISRNSVQVPIILLCGCLVMLYLRTLAPGVLVGDSGEFQYLPHVLGIPHEYGFPLYLIVGYFWSLIPIGSVAFRMNLLSAVFALLTVATLYAFSRRITESTTGALIASAAYGVSISFWTYATVAERYDINVFLITCMLFAVWQWHSDRRERWFMCIALCLGLAATIHNTIVLIGPSILVWLALYRDARHWLTPSRLLRFIGVLALPLILFLYIPIRGLQLFNATETAPGLSVPLSVAQGLVAPLFTGNSVDQWLGYISSHGAATSLLSSISVGIGQLPSYGGLLLDNWHPALLALAILGLFKGLREAPRFFSGVLVYFFVDPTVSLAYGGRVPAYVMPTYIMVAFCVALGCLLMYQTVQSAHVHSWLKRVALYAGTLAVSGVLLLTVVTNFPHVDRSYDTASADYWTEVLDYPLDKDSALSAHEGDLRPFWYYQQIELKRPDLLALFPPGEDVLEKWVNARHHFYLVGALHNWSPELAKGYNVTPWGKIVYVSPLGDVPSCPLPPAPQPLAIEKRAMLDAVQMESRAAEPYEWVNMCWDVKAPVSEDTMISLRVMDLAGKLQVQHDDLLISSWYPPSTVEAGNRIVDFYRLRMPANAAMGTYEVHAVLYARKSDKEWIFADGSSDISLGRFEWQQ